MKTNRLAPPSDSLHPAGWVRIAVAAGASEESNNMEERRVEGLQPLPGEIGTQWVCSESTQVMEALGTSQATSAVDGFTMYATYVQNLRRQCGPTSAHLKNGDFNLSWDPVDGFHVH